MIRHAADGDLNEPSARIFGNAFARPLERGGEQRLLNSVFGRGEVMEAPHDRAEHLRRKVAQQVLGVGAEHRFCHETSSVRLVMIWRTSMGMLVGTPPGPGPDESRAAI